MTHAVIESLATPRAWAIDLAACAATGAILGVIGPFGSFFNDTLPMRVVYWTAIFVLSGVLLGAAVRWVWPRALDRGVPVWTWIPALAIAGAVPLSPATRAIATAIWPEIREAVGAVEWYGQSVLVGLLYLSLYVAFRSRTPRPGRDVAAAPDEPRILDRLPSRIGRDLLCLQMEDHYVRLHTARGSVLVLMTLSQAIAEVGATEGRQVHRSWWVARHAVEGVVKDGRNLRLRLASGLEAPIARAKIAELRAAGWLPSDDA